MNQETDAQKRILGEYDNQRDHYNECLEYVRTLIKKFLDDEDIQYHEINGRIKERDSLKNKIISKDKYVDLSEITDICGIRIITYFSDDVDKIATLLSKEFQLDEENSIDKRKSKDPTKFGYVSLHYILQLDKIRSNLPENKKFRNLKFEVQIRTILQHAWAEIEHDFGYKSEKDVPEKIRRRFSRLASLIELADDEFLEIKKYENAYKKEIVEEIEEEIEESKAGKMKIDSVSISALLDSKSFNDFLNKHYSPYGIEVKAPRGKFKDFRISKIVSQCENLKFATIDKLASEFKKNFPSYFENWIKDKKNYFYIWNITPLLDVINELSSTS